MNDNKKSQAMKVYRNTAERHVAQAAQKVADLEDELRHLDGPVGSISAIRGRQMQRQVLEQKLQAAHAAKEQALSGLRRSRRGV